MATQDIAVDGWALTMLSKTNRGRGPLCNSIGQNIGYFLSFTGFLALNDPESAETLWRPLFRWPSKPGAGLISLGGFIRAMGMLILLTTVMVAWLKPEVPSKFVNAEVEAILVKPPTQRPSSSTSMNEDLLDARMGCVETYRRLWEICRLSSVRVLFFILMTYRLPTSLSDNAKFLKAVELGLPKSTTAILSPTVILPLGIITPIVANRVWHGHPLQQFLIAYFIRVTIVPLLDIMMLLVIRQRYDASSKLTTPVMSMLGDSVGFFWFFVISSTAVQAIVQSLQFNAQMTFFASRADPAIGGSYMTLLNTAANMGGTWPSSVVLLLLGRLTRSCQKNTLGNIWCSIGGIGDPYFVVQIVFATLGCLWILSFRKLLDWVASLPEDAWKTHIPESKTRRESFLDIEAAINGDAVTAAVHRSTSKRE
jgi:PAT family acetyl-CoA transporter-like MFS transporter 1